MTIPALEKPAAKPKRRAGKPPTGKASRVLPGGKLPEAPGPAALERPDEEKLADAYRVVMVCGYYAGND